MKRKRLAPFFLTIFSFSPSCFGGKDDLPPPDHAMSTSPAPAAKTESSDSSENSRPPFNALKFLSGLTTKEAFQTTGASLLQ